MSCSWRRLFPMTAFCVVASVFASGAPAMAETPADFQAWVAGFAREAKARGVEAAVVDQAMERVSYLPRVIELDRRQPEFSLTFWRYLNNSVSDERVKRGRELLKKHAGLLSEIERKYGVQPRFLVAFWGLESNFGDFTGAFPVLSALATLAHDARRSKFFRAQLHAVVEMMAKGDIPLEVKASWAGAMGNAQFIPTTYKAYAVDGDGDGKRDMWRSLPDIFASAANYLSKSGWRGDKTWGREVKLPKGFNYALSGLDTRKKLEDWAKLGIRKADGGTLPTADIDASLILPAGASGPAFLVYKNYRTILIWNRSILYALAVGHLADRLIGRSELLAKQPAREIPLARRDIAEIQSRLTARGFDTKGADGVAGPNTRRAIKAFQKSIHLPPDGFPNAGLLERLRGR